MQQHMQYQEAMQKCRDYITEHLDSRISAQDLADLCGYSLYHFCHVFRACFDMAPGEYIRKQKLKAAAADIRSGAGITETALASGFDTPSGFSKAFKREFGISAQQYRLNCQKTGGSIMKVDIRQQDAKRALGYNIPEPDVRNNVNDPAYWETIDFKQYPDFPEGAENKGDIGMFMHPDQNSGDLYYFFGFETDLTPVPDGFHEIVIPDGEYAFFDTEIDPASYSRESAARAVKDAWKEIFTEWFDSQKQYAFNEAGMCYEYYKGDQAWVVIPVKEA
ncbi:MAG: AraC family transcriptional regulator [Eubacteriaceae bacterium]|jgi:AraC family transcriptional regulator